MAAHPASWRRVLRIAVLMLLCATLSSRIQSVHASTTTTVTLPAAQGLPGVDTGIDVTAGQVVTWHSSGVAKYLSGTGTSCSDTPYTTPDGALTFNGGQCPGLVFFPDTVYPSATVGSVLARIGTGAWFPMGATVGDTVATTSGRLFLLYNDDNYTDNSGSYSEVITLSLPTKLAFVQQPPSSIQAGTPFATPVRVAIEEADGSVDVNSFTVAIVQLTATGGPGSLTCEGANEWAPTNAVVTFNQCAIDKPGTYVLHASTVSALVPLTATDSTTVTVTGAQPTGRYLALGDSVPDGEDLGGCPTGTNCKTIAYPQALTQFLPSVALQNLACSGATTADFRTQTSCHGVSYPGGSQLGAAVGTGTHYNVITLTLGADNLLSLLSQISNAQCLSSAGDQNRCDSLVQNATDQVRRDLISVLPQLASHANIVVVTGYYHIFPIPFPNRQISPTNPVDDDIDLLNAAISSAVVHVTAEQGINNIFYQDLVPAFKGHEYGSGDSWLIKRIECQSYPDITKLKSTLELILALAEARKEGGGTGMGCVLVPAVHPTAFGQKQIANTVWQHLGTMLTGALH